MRVALILFAMALFCPGALAQKREPKYQGKPLDYWVERLQKAETDKDREAAAAVIKQFGPDAAPAVPALIEMLDDHAADFRWMALEILAKIGPAAKDVAPELVKRLKQKIALKPEQREKENDHRLHVSEETNKLEFRYSETEAMLVLLGMIADGKEAVPVLITALSQPDLKEAAIQALLMLGPVAKEAIPEIRKVILELTDLPDEIIDPQGRTVKCVRSDPDIGLYKLGPDVLPLLMELLDSPTLYAKRCALMEIVKLAPDVKKVAPKLIIMLRVKNPDLRFHVSAALWAVDKNEAVIPVLAALLNENDAQLVRATAAQLADIGPDAKEALPALRSALKKASSEIPMLPGLALSDAAVVANAIKAIESAPKK